MILFDREKVKNMIENKIRHPYLQKHIDQPFIDFNKIDTLLMMYDDVNVTEQEKYHHIVSIMLVQIALDTHDRVSNKTETPSSELEKQLSVLAGDFYSGLYYKTLADIEERDLVRVLANAIKMINEYKMILYKYEIKSWEQLMRGIQIIESSLIINVGQLYKISLIDEQYISESLLVNRLVKELETIKCNQLSYIQQYVNQNMMDIYEPSLIYSLEREITGRQEKMKDLTNESTFSFGKLNDMLFHKKVLSAVEEG